MKVLNYRIEKLQVAQMKPPWYWRMIGRKYWSGWMVRGLVHYGDAKGVYFASPPAPKPPTPGDVARATADAVMTAVVKLEENRRFDAEHGHMMDIHDGT